MYGFLVRGSTPSGGLQPHLVQNLRVGNTGLAGGILEPDGPGGPGGVPEVVGTGPDEVVEATDVVVEVTVTDEEGGSCRLSSLACLPWSS